jgi:hypothetical protein
MKAARRARRAGRREKISAACATALRACFDSRAQASRSGTHVLGHHAPPLPPSPLLRP